VELFPPKNSGFFEGSEIFAAQGKGQNLKFPCRFSVTIFVIKRPQKSRF